MRWLRLLLVLMALALPAARAGAHPVPFSYLDLHLESPGAARLDGTLVVHAFDVAHDLQIDSPERMLDASLVRARFPAIAAMMGARFRLSADGNPLIPSWTGWDVVPDKQSLRLRFSCALSRAPGIVGLSAQIFPYDPNHQTFVNVYEGVALRSQAILDARHTSLEYFSGSRHGDIAIGRRLVEEGVLHDPEDTIFLQYNELRRLLGVPKAFAAKPVVSKRRDEREAAYEVRPREWVGTATKVALDFPYNGLWGFPDKFYRKPPATTGAINGLAASPGVVEGPARYVHSLDEFDQVRKGEILVCQMTNPAWVVLFTKIVGLVTDAGGTVSHPAVVSREFGIPAVVGTSNATQRIKTGDRIRVNGSTGVVEILG